MSKWVPERVEQEELLDQGLGSAEDVSANLAEMHRTHRYLGGAAALNRHLYPRLLHGQGAALQTVLDLGVGGAGMAGDVARWARRRGLPVQVWGVDRAWRHLVHAAGRAKSERNLHLLCADAAHPPLAPCSVDWVISSLFMHHFSPPALVQLLRGAFDLARGGLVMSDLVRGWVPYYAFQLLRPVFARNFLTAHDGALSIRRSYTPKELLDLARAAGLRSARVYTHFPAMISPRMTLVAER